MMNRREFLLLTGAAALPASSRKPNIVLIYADDVGYGDVSCYGATRVHTPNIDSLASRGIRFTNAHAPSATCTPSRYALMTGEYAWRMPGTGILPGDAPLIVKPGRVTLPSMLHEQGYRTGAVGKWHLGLGTGKIDWNGEIKPGPLEIGFDYSFLIPATLDRVPCVFVEDRRVVNLDPKDPIEISYQKPFPGEPTGKNNPELLKMLPSHGHDQAIVNGVSRIGYMTGGKSALWTDETIVDVLTSKACAFIDGNRNRQPFFLYYASPDIHVPRLPNPRFAGKTEMGPRGDAIAELDWSVGEILKALDRNGLAENTLVIFSSDNGPVVDDGYKDQAVEKLGGHKPAGPYRGGKYSNFDGGTRVPFIVRWPGHVKPDSQSNALIGQVDLLSSLASLTGQSLPEQAAPDSMNVLPALLGESKQGRRELVEDAGVQSLIAGDWKLIRPSDLPSINKNTDTELGNAPKPQLYNLARDPGEKNDLANSQPARVEAMMTQLEGIRAARRTRP
jgi:arylsulfatase A-like enzyme